MQRRNPTGSLSHTRDPIEGFHVGGFAKLFVYTRGLIQCEAIAGLLPYEPITPCR